MQMNDRVYWLKWVKLFKNKRVLMSYIRCRGFKFIHKLIVQIAFKNSDYQNKEWSLALSLYLED